MQLVSFTGSMKKSFHFQDQGGEAVEFFARELGELMSQLSGPRPRSWGRSAREEGLTLQRGAGRGEPGLGLRGHRTLSPAHQGYSPETRLRTELVLPAEGARRLTGQVASNSAGGLGDGRGWGWGVPGEGDCLWLSPPTAAQPRSQKLASALH